MMRGKIEESLRALLDEMQLPTEGVVVEYTDSPENGDITTNAAMVVAKSADKNPQEMAKELVQKLDALEGVERVEIAGPGFINLTLTADAIIDEVSKIDTEYGKNESKKGERVMVEYTDPNPFKEFHIGHLMSNAIGESIARLVEYMGAEVYRANYQGDVGPHVARALWGKIQNTELSWGEAYAYGSVNYEANKEAIDTINRQVYDRSDEKINKLYDLGKAESLEHFEKLYAILGTKFDHYFFESETAPIGLDLIQNNKEIFTESDGAIVYEGEQDGLHTRVFVTSQGLPTYETKDLGLIKLKTDTYKADQSIYITANEQQEYFKVMFAAAARIMPDLVEKTLHLAHGMMRLSSGKMSSRTGDVITGESLLMKLIEAAKERAAQSKAEDSEKLGEQIAVAAIKYQILRQGLGRDIIFDEEKALSLDGDSGPYIQYAHARALSVIAAAKEAGVAPEISAPQTALERELCRTLMQFGDVVARAQNEYAPHYVASYVTNLASQYNSWYAQERVLGTPDAARRLAMTNSVAATLKNALYLLGISTPEKM